LPDTLTRTRIQVWVIHTDEESIIAKDATRLLAKV